MTSSIAEPTYPKPLLKWAGGKRGILDELVASMPEEYGDYWEPFMGGGSLFFRLSVTEHTNFHLSDINEDLITTYKAVRSRRKKLQEALDEMSKLHSEEYYYEIRDGGNPSDIVERAARFIFINKTGYNGLIRYNSKGDINTPWGHKKNPVTLYDPDNLLECSLALTGVDLSSKSYRSIKPKIGDFVYLDPPYDDAYNGYSKNGFGVEGQKELAEFCRKLDGEGVLWMLSNSDTELINDLYSEYKIKKITAPRSVSCKGDGRKPVKEVLVTNYD